MSSPNVLILPSKHDPESVDALSRIEKSVVLDVRVNVLTRPRLSALLRECLDRGYSGWISYVNVHALNLAAEEPWFRLFLNNSLLTYCDGQGVRLGAAILGSSLPERIVMTDWIYNVCEMSVLRQARVYLLGGKQVVIERTAAVLREMYPDLNLVGFHHGHISDLESENVVHSINSEKPDILIVGMGMPVQEEWILRYRDRLDVQIILNAGSCFDYVAGFKKRCPTWMGVMGLEWLYRLAQEPGRLWKRYLIGNPLFLYRVVKTRISSSRPDANNR